MRFPAAPASRRHVLTTAATGLAAGALLVPFSGADAVPSTRRGARQRRLEDVPGGVSALDLPVTGAAITARRASAWRTDAIETTPFRMIGATWRSGRPDLQVRFRRRGTWSDWHPMRHLHDVPDRDTDEGRRAARHAVELMWVDRADAVQLEVAGGETPEDLVLTLIHPGRRAADHVTVPAERPRAKGGEKGKNGKGDDDPVVRGKVPPPTLYTRSQWGADPRLRSGRPTYCRTIQQVHVHHTVSVNDYSRDDVAGLIRGMYRYHTQNLGWSDIGYNFLVDKFGRVWVGRAGGPKKAVQGAHTLGFNNSSTGVSVIGNFETTRPNTAILHGIATLAAWKLDIYKRLPRGTQLVTSTGSDKFPPGRQVRLPTIDGHRDTNDTACPGINLYRQLPDVRDRTFTRMRRFRRAGAVPERRQPGDG